MGDCLATLVALSSGRSVERLGTQLANTTPTDAAPPPVTVAPNAEQVNIEANPKP